METVSPPLSSPALAPSAPPGPPVNAPDIDLARVHHSYGEGTRRVIALRPLDLVVPAGRIVALTGRSGSGKSTLLNILGGVDLPTGGTVRIAGQPLTGDTRTPPSPDQLALFRRRFIGYVFQSFHLVPTLSVLDNVLLPFLLDRRAGPAETARAKALLARVGLDDPRLAARYPDELSGGQQQRVAIARAVIHRPRLLLADEPTGNLDVKSGRAVLDLLVDVARENAATVVLATHSEEAAARCSAGLTLEDGRVLESFGDLTALTHADEP